MGTAAFVNPFLAGKHRPADRPAPPPMRAAPRATVAGRALVPDVPVGPVTTLLAALLFDRTGVGSAAEFLNAPPSNVALAVTFAALVDDGASSADPAATRARRFDLMRRLTAPSARRDDALLAEVRAEVRLVQLRPVPPDTADDDALYRQAQAFRAQEALGGDEAIEALFTERYDEFRTTGRWRGTLVELRACFWYYWLWAERHGAGSAGTAADHEALRALYRQVRMQWGELAEDVERALEPFRGVRASGGALRPSAAIRLMDGTTG